MSKVKGTWHEVVQFASPLAEQVVEIPEGQRYTVRGPIDNVIVVQIPAEEIHKMSQDGSMEAVFEGIQQTVRGGGFEGGIIIVPSSLQFMKLRPVDKVMSKMLELRDKQQKKHYRKVDSEPPEDVTELHPDTKVAGEA